MSGDAIMPATQEVRPLRQLYFELGQALLVYQRYPEAVSPLEKALEESGDTPAAGNILFLLARAQQQVGDVQKAFRSYLQAVLSLSEWSDTIFSSLQGLLTPSLVVAENEWLKKQWLPRIDPSAFSAEAWASFAFFLGRLYLYLGEYDSALKYFEQARQVSGENVYVLEGLGMALWRLDRREEAVEVFQQARQRIQAGQHPERLVAVNTKLAQVLADLGRYNEALTLLDETPVNPDASAYELLLTRGLCYFALNRFETALEIVETAIQQKPERLQAYLQRIQVLIALKRYEDALDSVDQALQIDPSDRQLLFYKSQALIEGQVDLEQGRQLLKLYLDGCSSQDEALTQIDSPAFTTRGDDGNMHYFLAQCYGLLERPEKALEEVGDALALGGKGDANSLEVAAWELKAQLQEQLGEKEAAAESFYEAGRRRGWQNEFAAAAALLTKSKELNPQSAATYWELANTVRMLGYLPNEPPYLDPERIRQSRQLFEEGLHLALPDANMSWAYTLGAIICESQATLAPDFQQRWNFLWEGVLYIERAIILLQEDAYRWASLARYYRTSNLESASLAWCEQALAYDAASTVALDERAAILANVGRFDEAIAAIERRRELEPNAWADVVKGYILLHEEHIKEALDLIQRAVEATSKDIWFLSMRALCYQLLGETAKAREDYLAIWQQYSPTDLNNQSAFGNAAYRLEKFEQSAEIYKRLLDDPLQEKASVYSSLAILDMIRGDMQASEQGFERSLALAINVRQVDDLVRIDIADLEKKAERWSYAEQAREIFRRVKEKAAARREQLLHERPVEQELEEALAGLADPKEKNLLAWLGLQASLARLYLKNGSVEEAEGVYRLLQQYPTYFPEARQILIALYQQQGDQLLKEDRRSEALARYTNILDLDLFAGSAKGQGQLQSRLGYTCFLLGDSVHARQHFIEALREFREEGLERPGMSLGNVCRSLLQNTVLYWFLDGQWRTMAEEAGEDATLRDDLEAARLALKPYLSEVFGLTANSRDFSLVLDRIRLEIGESLVPEDTSDETPIVTSYIPQMRQRIRQKMGVQIPPVRVMDNAGLADEAYVIILDEVMVTGGKVPLHKDYFPVAPNHLRELGIPVEAIQEEPHPLTGAPGAWVDPAYRELCIRNKLDVWIDPLIFIVYRLEAVLYENLAQFLTLTDVEVLVESWRQEDEGRVKASLPDEQAYLCLARVLRCLIKEQVPIVAWGDILSVLQEHQSPQTGIEVIVMAARLRLKNWLPGNNQKLKLIKLPADVEDRIKRWTFYEDGKIRFTASPQETRELQAEIKALLETTGEETEVALVTGRTELRFFIRQLLADAFPTLLIMAQGELSTELDEEFSFA